MPVRGTFSDFERFHMSSQIKQPDLKEMKAIVAAAERCIDCDAPECHEFTPEGVDVCAELPYYNGRPVTREMLRAWKAALQATEK